MTLSHTHTATGRKNQERSYPQEIRQEQTDASHTTTHNDRGHVNLLAQLLPQAEHDQKEDDRDGQDGRVVTSRRMGESTKGA